MANSYEPRKTALTEEQLQRYDALVAARDILGTRSSTIGSTSTSGVEEDAAIRVADFILGGWHDALAVEEPAGTVTGHAGEVRLVSVEDYAAAVGEKVDEQPALKASTHRADLVQAYECLKAALKASKDAGELDPYAQEYAAAALHYLTLQPQHDDTENQEN